MRIVMKFGGSSIGNGSNFGHVAKIINSMPQKIMKLLYWFQQWQELPIS